MKRNYITEKERVKCKKVADAFRDALEDLGEELDAVILDAGKYGYVKLQYYSGAGFDDTRAYIDSMEMFEDFWDTWFGAQLYLLAQNTPMAEMEKEEIFECLPKEKQKEFMDKKAYFMEKAGIGCP